MVWQCVVSCRSEVVDGERRQGHESVVEVMRLWVFDDQSVKLWVVVL